jgi:hypothetical protein
MLCFNYIANIIKLMGLLSREGMRDVDIGICWDAGHIGICGGYAGICGTDHLPEIGPAGLPFFGPAPPNPRRTGNRNGKRSASQKKELLFFDLTYWSSII